MDKYFQRPNTTLGKLSFRNVRLKNMRTITQMIIILCLATILTGCGTIVASGERFADPTPAGLYPATRYDGKVIDAGGGSFLYPDGSGIVILLSVIDLPISLVTDTVFFPYDIVKERKPRDTETIEQDECTVPVKAAPSASSSVR